MTHSKKNDHDDPNAAFDGAAQGGETTGTAQPEGDGPVSGANGPVGEPEGPQGQGGGEDTLRNELADARDRHLRLAAEFDNYRKRVERERADSYLRAQAQLAEKLLDALDDLQRIADYDPATTPSQALHEGAEMVEKKFLRALESAGLELVDAEGRPFDPTQHEAIATVPTEASEEDDTVADVFQKGYRFKGLLLRPARVRVKKYGG
jgi:molecular chaperone GrpE